MKLNLESKISDIFKHYPYLEEKFKPYLSYFYEEKLDGILFRKLSLMGALKLLNLPEEDREKIIQEFYKTVNKHWGGIMVIEDKEQEVKEVLEKIRPALMADAGNIDLVKLKTTKCF